MISYCHSIVASLVYATIPMAYGIRMEEDAWEAKLPHEPGKVGGKASILRV